MTSSASPLIDALRDGVTIYDLGRDMFNGMPQSASHPQFAMTLQRRHGDLLRADGSSGANEIIVTGGHVGTHIDALCHNAFAGEMFGGHRVDEAQRGGRFAVFGAETIPPMVCRGLLLDVAAAKHTDACDAGYEITIEDLEAALAYGGIAPAPDDVLLIRSGWGRHFHDRTRFQSEAEGAPGPGEAGARWLASHRPRAVGSDTISFEHLAPRGAPRTLPAHRVLLNESGVYIIELLDLEALSAARCTEFVFVISSLKLVGATGSPVRPLAIVDTPRASDAADR